jgi:hypothetical protein
MTYKIDKEKLTLAIDMLQERFAGDELTKELVSLIESTAAVAYKEGAHQGYIDNNPCFDHSLGGFHSDY